MIKLMASVSLGLGLVASSVAFAGERTITLGRKKYVLCRLSLHPKS
jgi:hypothetical protein